MTMRGISGAEITCAAVTVEFRATYDASGGERYAVRLTKNSRRVPSSPAVRSSDRLVVQSGSFVVSSSEARNFRHVATTSSRVLKTANFFTFNLRSGRHWCRPYAAPPTDFPRGCVKPCALGREGRCVTTNRFRAGGGRHAARLGAERE